MRPPHQAPRLRNDKPRCLMADLKANAEHIASDYPGSRQLPNGVHYILNHWDGLTRCLNQPDLPPDNTR